MVLHRADVSVFLQDPWNLNLLPLAQGSLLRHLGKRVTGCMVPWLYVGSMFSAFCWHNEDHLLYSINYHHFGAPKVGTHVHARNTMHAAALVLPSKSILYCERCKQACCNIGYFGSTCNSPAAMGSASVISLCLSGSRHCYVAHWWWAVFCSVLLCSLCCDSNHCSGGMECQGLQLGRLSQQWLPCCPSLLLCSQTSCCSSSPWSTL